MGYFLAFFGGMLVGIVSSCILLAKKNLERMQRVENSLEKSVDYAKMVYNVYSQDPAERETADEDDTMTEDIIEEE